MTAHTQTTATTNSSLGSLTLADIERAAAELRSMPPPPIGEWMREQGCPPESWRLFLPSWMKERLDDPALLPDYVAFSDLVDKPVMVQRSTI